jgi:hypothetical protein
MGSVQAPLSHRALPRRTKSLPLSDPARLWLNGTSCLSPPLISLLSAPMPADFHRCTVYYHLIKPDPRASLQSWQHLCPQPAPSLPRKPVINGMPMPTFLRQIPPGGAGSQYVQYPAKSLIVRPPFPNVVSLYNWQYRFIEGRLVYRIQPFVYFYDPPSAFTLYPFTVSAYLY